MYGQHRQRRSREVRVAIRQRGDLLRLRQYEPMPPLVAILLLLVVPAALVAFSRGFVLHCERERMCRLSYTLLLVPVETNEFPAADLLGASSWSYSCSKGLRPPRRGTCEGTEILWQGGRYRFHDGLTDAEEARVDRWADGEADEPLHLRQWSPLGLLCGGLTTFIVVWTLRATFPGNTVDIDRERGRLLARRRYPEGYTGEAGTIEIALGEVRKVVVREGARVVVETTEHGDVDLFLRDTRPAEANAVADTLDAFLGLPRGDRAEVPSGPA